MIKLFIRSAVARWRPWWLYPIPPSGLQPERLYVYLDELAKRQNRPGDIVEIGCWLGGTAATASKFLARTGHPRRYLAVDTFSGFVPDQFDRDQAHGTPQRDRGRFSRNSRLLVRRLLDHYGVSNVELLEGDIVQLDAVLLPEQIVVALVDVDLELPVYEALRKLWPRLVPGGIILVDDCPEQTSWAGARVGYSRFMAERGLPERYRHGMGLLEALDDVRRKASTAPPRE
jgi:O-methyltransferase